MGEPINPWVMEMGSIIFWSVLVVVSALLAIRTRRLSLVALMLLGATSSFWQEFFGDWGAYVAWNPHFARLPFWGEMPFTTPVKPLFIPFSWGWWFAVSIPILVLVIRGLHRLLRRVSVPVLSLFVAFPLFVAYELYAEGGAVANGWWTYDVVIGPIMQSDKGRLPVIFPVLLGAWAAWLIAILAQPDARGWWWHERALGVDGIPAGGRRELARAGAFILLFQVTTFAVNILPAILGRLAFGGPSTLVP